MLDSHLEEIVKLAFAANASETEYHFRKYVAGLYSTRASIEKHIDQILTDDPDFCNNRIASLENQTEKLTKEILRLETMMSSSLCK